MTKQKAPSEQIDKAEISNKDLKDRLQKIAEILSIMRCPACRLQSGECMKWRACEITRLTQVE